MVLNQDSCFFGCTSRCLAFVSRYARTSGHHPKNTNMKTDRATVSFFMRCHSYPSIHFMSLKCSSTSKRLAQIQSTCCLVHLVVGMSVSRNHGSSDIIPGRRSLLTNRHSCPW